MPPNEFGDEVTMPSADLTQPFLRLKQPLADLDAWVACFRDAEIPVRAETAAALEAMRQNEDDVDANLIGEMISGDPLMTLKVMAFAAKHRSARLVTAPETVTSTLVMMGISPFFRAFGPQTVLEDVLQDPPEALVGLSEVLRGVQNPLELLFPCIGLIQTQRSSTRRHCSTTSPNCCCGAMPRTLHCRSAQPSVTIQRFGLRLFNSRYSMSNLPNCSMP